MYLGFEKWTQWNLCSWLEVVRQKTRHIDCFCFLARTTVLANYHNEWVIFRHYNILVEVLFVQVKFKPSNMELAIREIVYLFIFADIYKLKILNLVPIDFTSETLNNIIAARITNPPIWTWLFIMALSRTVVIRWTQIAHSAVFDRVVITFSNILEMFSSSCSTTYSTSRTLVFFFICMISRINSHRRWTYIPFTAFIVQLLWLISTFWTPIPFFAFSNIFFSYS